MNQATRILSSRATPIPLRTRSFIEKRGGSPALIARDNGHAITFTKGGAQLQDWAPLSKPSLSEAEGTGSPPPSS